MIYPFMTWHDNIEVVHSDMAENEGVKVIFEESIHIWDSKRRNAIFLRTYGQKMMIFLMLK